MQQEPFLKASKDRTGLSTWISPRSGVLGTVLIGALLLLAAGCGGATEERDDSFAVGESPSVLSLKFFYKNVLRSPGWHRQSWSRRMVWGAY